MPCSVFVRSDLASSNSVSSLVRKSLLEVLGLPVEVDGPASTLDFGIEAVSVAEIWEG